MKKTTPVTSMIAPATITTTLVMIRMAFMINSHMLSLTYKYTEGKDIIMEME